MKSSNNQVLNHSNEMLQIAKHAAEESKEITEQAALDALWRMKQDNAIAKVKGMSKLMETVNQL